MEITRETLGAANVFFDIRKVPKLRQRVFPLPIPSMEKQLAANHFLVTKLDTETGDARILVGDNNQERTAKDIEFALVVKPEQVANLVKLLNAVARAEEEKPEKETIAPTHTVDAQGNVQKIKLPWYKRILGG